MEKLLNFLENPTSNATLIIVVALIVVAPNIPYIAKYIPILNKIFKISDTQDEKYPQVLQGIEIMKKLDKIADNHLHELPDMKRAVDRIEEKLDDIYRISSSHGERISKIEGRIDRA